MTAWRQLLKKLDVWFKVAPEQTPTLSEQKFFLRLTSILLIIVSLYGGFQAARFQQYQKNGWINIPVDNEGQNG